MLRMKKGHIVTIASMASFVAAPGLVDYCCSKVGALYISEGQSERPLLPPLRRYFNIDQVSAQSVAHVTPAAKASARPPSTPHGTKQASSRALRSCWHSTVLCQLQQAGSVMWLLSRFLLRGVGRFVFRRVRRGKPGSEVGLGGRRTSCLDLSDRARTNWLLGRRSKTENLLLSRLLLVGNVMRDLLSVL